MSTETVLTLNKKALALWAVIIIVAIALVTIIVNVRSHAAEAHQAEAEQAVTTACLDDIVKKAASNGMNWDGVPEQQLTNLVTEYSGSKNDVWLSSGTIPAGAAPWASGKTYFSCKVDLTDSNYASKVYESKIFG